MPLKPVCGPVWKKFCSSNFVRMKDRIVAHALHVPIRREPSDTAEMVNSMLMGETARIVEQPDDMWFLVETDLDGYTGYVSATMTSETPEKLPAETHRVEVPFLHGSVDGLAKFLPIGTPLIPFQEGYKWGKNKVFKPNNPLKPLEKRPFVEAVLETAASMLDTPYLWGGRSVLGVDCSGLTHTAALLTGLVLPRDARDQAHVGEPVSCIEDLQRGDWVFFSPEPDRPMTHVGLYVGDGRFIHASGLVRYNHFDPVNPEFSAKHLEQFRFGRRIKPALSA